MKTIAFVSMASLLIASATLSVVRTPEKIPLAVWKEIPTLPGSELTDQELLEMNRIYGQIPAAGRDATATNRSAKVAGPPSAVVHQDEEPAAQR